MIMQHKRIGWHAESRPPTASNTDRHGWRRVQRAMGEKDVSLIWNALGGAEQKRGEFAAKSRFASAGRFKKLPVVRLMPIPSPG